MKNFLNKYFDRIKLNLDKLDSDKLQSLVNNIERANANNKKIIFVGNGGSASIAGHMTIDTLNAAKIRALNFNTPEILTCFSNDYGYENWVSKALECYADKGDVVVLISSSGKSENIINGAKTAKEMGLYTATFSGFKPDNPLRGLGDSNIWVDSEEYNVVEMTHHIWLLAAIDYVIDNKNGG